MKAKNAEELQARAAAAIEEAQRIRREAESAAAASESARREAERKEREAAARAEKEIRAREKAEKRYRDGTLSSYLAEKFSGRSRFEAQGEQDPRS